MLLVGAFVDAPTPSLDVEKEVDEEEDAERAESLGERPEVVLAPAVATFALSLCCS